LSFVLAPRADPAALLPSCGLVGFAANAFSIRRLGPVIGIGFPLVVNHGVHGVSCCDRSGERLRLELGVGVCAETAWEIVAGVSAAAFADI